VTAVTALAGWDKYYRSMENVVQPGCITCDFRPGRFFCDMSAESLRTFDEIKSLVSYPNKTILFAEGRPVRGIFILCDGHARVSIGANSCKRLTLRVAGPGEVLGLGAALSNTPYEVTAQLLDGSQVVFIRRTELLKFLRQNPEVCTKVVRMLSQDLHGAYERVRTIGMGHSRRPRSPMVKKLIFASEEGEFTRPCPACAPQKHLHAQTTTSQQTGAS